jgi:sugar lactone lactonase YvrE
VRADSALDFGPPYIITGNFLRPYGIALDEAHGRLMVADTGHHRFKWTNISDLTRSYSFREFGYIADRNDAAALTDPQAIAVDGAGNVYVVNTLKGNVKCYSWSGSGYALSTTFVINNPRIVDGVAIQMPRDIAVGQDGKVYLLDSGNKRILVADGPEDTSWSVLTSDPSWANPYGLAVDATGALYVADTDNHRIVKIAGSTITTFGRWGTGRAEFRYPRDVAVDRRGRIFVADTFNHRIQVLTSEGRDLFSLGSAPAMGTIEKVVVDSSDRMFVVDSDNNHVVAFLGADTARAFDPFVRDYVGDSGDEPSSSLFVLSSPDLLVRYHPDIDLVAAAMTGLESYAFQQPRSDETNYVYIAVHNRRTQVATDTFAELYWYDPGTPGRFPDDWRESGFYSSYSDATHNTPGNSLAVPPIPGNGVVVIGPIVWRPPTPDSAMARDGVFRLGVRIANPYDYPPSEDSLTILRASNNVSERRVLVLRGPSPAGNQDTLVVLVNYRDIMRTIDPTAIEARINELANWIHEASWGEATVVTGPIRGPITLSHDRSYYAAPSNHLLVEMTQEVLNRLAPGDLTASDSSGGVREIGRVVLVTNDVEDVRDWATTGSWPYMVGGRMRYLSVSIQGADNPLPLFSHGMSHQLNMLDLYPFEGVTFPRPYIEGWDNMARPFNGASPLVWSKELSNWVTTHGSNIVYIPRPAPGAIWNNGGNPIGLYYQETASRGQNVALAFGLTNGVTSMSDETAFYFVEARRNSGPGAGSDSVLPQTGVLMYYVNTRIPQGQGPVILRDHVPDPTGNLNDAAIPIDGSETVTGAGITVRVQPGTGGADYNLAVQYNPPLTDYDVYLHAGDAPWASPDIWVDSELNDFDEDRGRPPQDRGEQGIAGHPNRLYARVFNTGPADAHDVEVVFMISEPYHTVGGEASFSEYRSVFIDTLPAGHDQPVYVSWTPRTGVDPHTCVRVELRRLFNDNQAANNAAQRNLQIDQSTHHSPYTPVEFHFQVRNEEPSARPIYFRTEGVPADWTWSITPDKVFLSPGASASGTLRLQPPPGAADCTSHKMYVTSWVPRGDTLIRLGGVTVQVDLRQPTDLNLKLSLDNCRSEDLKSRRDDNQRDSTGARLPAKLADVNQVQSLLSENQQDDRKCFRLSAAGCTNPSQPNQDIVLRYQEPDGRLIYHTVRTDSGGCFGDFNVVVEGGEWGVTAEFEGTECKGTARAENTIKVPLPEVDRPDNNLPDLERQLYVSAFSKDIAGKIGFSAPGDSGLNLELIATGHIAGAKDGLHESVVEIFDLQDLLVGPDNKAGMHRGRFRWKEDGMAAVGWVVGLTNLGTHRDPACLSCPEMETIPGHRELSLDGTIVEGEMAGARLHVVIALDTARGDARSIFVPQLKGTLKGIVERDYLLSEVAKQQRIQRALAESKQLWTKPFGDGFSYLKRIAKEGRGLLVLYQKETDQNTANRPGVHKTWSSFNVELKGNFRLEGPQPSLGDGVLNIDSFVQVLDQTGQGEHAGTFEFKSTDGVWIKGQMMGITQLAARGDSTAKSIKDYSPKRHLEGRLIGITQNGPDKDSRVETRYLIELDESKNRRQNFVMVMDGWKIGGPSEATLEKTQGSTGPAVLSTSDQVKETAQFKELLEPNLKLSDEYYRPLSELPQEVVKSLQGMEGGKLTSEGERQLRIADREFLTLDVDKTGGLDIKEFELIFHPAVSGNDNKAVGHSIEKDIARQYLDLLDKDKNGIVAKLEAGEAWKILAPLDNNKDDSLSESELEGAYHLSAKREFERADSNHDKRISFLEFVLWWRTLPRVV